MSTATKYLQTLEENIPQDLQNIKQYITCRHKIPEVVRPDGTVIRRWNDKRHWATLEGVQMLASQHGLQVGFVMSELFDTYEDRIPYCIDLDKCYGKPEALAVIERLNSYTEVSISGGGYHIFGWVKGTDYQYICGKRQIKVAGLKGSDCRFYGNYVVLTGDVVEGFEAMSTVSLSTLESVLEVSLDRDFDTTGMVQEIVSDKTVWDSIDEDDPRWRQVIDFAEFDVELKHLLNNRIKKNNKLTEALPHEDDTGSGIAFRLLLRVWDIFTDPKDLMSVYEYAYRRASGGRDPSRSSVRASVWKILKEKYTTIPQGSTVKGIISESEAEIEMGTTHSVSSAAEVPEDDYMAARELFYQLAQSDCKIISFYQQPWDKKTLLVGCNGYEAEFGIVTSENIFYPATFKSKVAPYFGIYEATKAKLQAMVRVFMKCREPRPPIDVMTPRLQEELARRIKFAEAYQAAYLKTSKPAYEVRQNRKGEWQFASTVPQAKNSVASTVMRHGMARLPQEWAIPEGALLMAAQKALGLMPGQNQAFFDEILEKTGVRKLMIVEGIQFYSADFL